MDILAPLLKTKIGNRFIVVVAHRYSKLARAISAVKITADHTESFYLDAWIDPYGISDSAMIDDGAQNV